MSREFSIPSNVSREDAVLLKHMHQVYEALGDATLLRKFRNNAIKYSTGNIGIIKDLEITDEKPVLLRAEVQGGHGHRKVSWNKGRWSCNCDLSKDRGKFAFEEDGKTSREPRGECSHMMAIRIVANRYMFEAKLPSELIVEEEKHSR